MRQPRHNELLERFDAVLTAAEPHPYGPDSSQNLYSLSAYINAGAKGPPVVVSPERERQDEAADEEALFIYRAHHVEDVAWDDDIADLPSFAEQFQALQNATLGGWAKLKDFATGAIENLRGFSWWTAAEPTLDEIVKWMCSLGYVQDWLMSSMLLLKCPASFINSRNRVHVPSALDGFDSPIFLPPFYTEPSQPGMTISLNDCSTALGQGKSEYVLGPIPVDWIEFMPITLDVKDHNASIDDDRLLVSLIDYYRAQLGVEYE